MRPAGTGKAGAKARVLTASFWIAGGPERIICAAKAGSAKMQGRMLEQTELKTTEYAERP